MKEKMCWDNMPGGGGGELPCKKIGVLVILFRG